MRSLGVGWKKGIYSSWSQRNHTLIVPLDNPAASKLPSMLNRQHITSAFASLQHKRTSRSIISVGKTRPKAFHLHNMENFQISLSRGIQSRRRDLNYFAGGGKRGRWGLNEMHASPSFSNSTANRSRPFATHLQTDEYSLSTLQTQKSLHRHRSLLFSGAFSGAPTAPARYARVVWVATTTEF